MRTLLSIFALLSFCSCVSTEQKYHSDNSFVVHRECGKEILVAFNDSGSIDPKFITGKISTECARDLLFALNQSLALNEGRGK